MPRLADWAVVWWRDAAPGVTPRSGRSPRSIAIRRRASLLDALHRHSLAADRFGGVGRVLDAGEPEIVAAIDDDHLQRVAGDGDYLRVLRALGPRSHLMLPLAARGQLLGVLAMVQAELGRRYGPDDLALGRELAARAALALDNARLYQAEQAARRHLAVLAEAGAALTASLDFEATLARVARLVVPALADWCTVDLVNEDEPVGLRRLAAVHADPAKEALVAQSVDYPPRPPAEHPVLTVVRTGQPALGVDVSDGVIAAAARDAEHLALVRAIGMRSLMIVPLRVRERVLGAISLVAAEFGAALRAGRSGDGRATGRAGGAGHRQRPPLPRGAGGGAHPRGVPGRRLPRAAHAADQRQRVRPASRPPGARRRRSFGAPAGTIDPLHTQVRRLEMLVSDLLDVSRLQQGRLELRPERVELGELARQVVARFEHAPHRTPRHALVVDAPAPVTGEWDAARLDQVLTNLVGNALKFSPTGGEVRVVVRQEGGEALLVVSDEGLGIGPDERATLFQPFQRGEATARAIPRELDWACTSPRRSSPGTAGGSRSRAPWARGAPSSSACRLPNRRPTAGHRRPTQRLDGRPRRPPGLPATAPGGRIVARGVLRRALAPVAQLDRARAS